MEADKAEREGDLNKASELKYGRLPELQKQFEEESEKKLREKTEGRLLKEEVDEEDIAEIVSKWTGIPVNKMLEGEVEKLAAHDGLPQDVQCCCRFAIRVGSELEDAFRVGHDGRDATGVTTHVVGDLPGRTAAGRVVAVKFFFR